MANEKSIPQICDYYVDSLRHTMLEYKAKHGDFPYDINVAVSVADDCAATAIEKRLRKSGWVMMMRSHRPGDKDIVMRFATEGYLPE